MEGAALVVIKQGTHIVSVFDNIAGMTFSGTLTYILKFLTPTSGLVLWDNIGADGQSGDSLAPNPQVAGEKTFINGVQIAGPGAPNGDSDWNGSAALPLPQLFDVTGHNLTSVAPPGTTALGVRIVAQGDCITTIANIVAQ